MNRGIVNPELRAAATVGGFAGVGWAFCGAIMGVLPPLVGMQAALLVHGVAAPVAFAALAFVYQRRIGTLSPLAVAGAFLGVVALLDFFVVALLILGSLDMFRSAPGTWIPFGLLFLAAWGAGSRARRPALKN